MDWGKCQRAQSDFSESCSVSRGGKMNESNEMAISNNQKPTIYRNLYENTGPGHIGRQKCEADLNARPRWAVKLEWQIVARFSALVRQGETTETRQLLTLSGPKSAKANSVCSCCRHRPTQFESKHNNGNLANSIPISPSNHLVWMTNITISEQQTVFFLYWN